MPTACGRLALVYVDEDGTRRTSFDELSNKLQRFKNSSSSDQSGQIN
jgi:hypothetical protein